MKNIVYILFFTATLALFASCEIDNYAAPDASLTGTVIDVVTGKPYASEQPNGVNIRYREIDEKYPSAPERTFWVQADGAFQNTKLFAATYEVWPADGAFVPFSASERQRVTLSSGKAQSLTFTVTPYASIKSISVVKTGADAASITFSFAKNAGALQDYRIFATNKTPLVGANITDGVGGNPVALLDSEAGETVTVTADRTGFAAGSKYWIRVGVRCKEAPSGRFNLSETVEVQF